MKIKKIVLFFNILFICYLLPGYKIPDERYAYGSINEQKFYKNYLVVANGGNIMFLNISNLMKKVSFEIETPGNARDFIILNDLIVVADEYFGLLFYDIKKEISPEYPKIQKPYEPILLNNYNPLEYEGFIKIRKLEGDLIICLGINGSLHILDISDIKNIKEVYYQNGNYKYIETSGNKIFLKDIDGYFYIFIFDVELKMIYSTQSGTESSNFCLFKNYVFIAGIQILVLDISDIENVKIINKIKSSPCYYLKVEENRYLFSFGWDISVWDISNISSPFLIFTEPFCIEILNFIKIEDKAFIGTPDFGLLLYEIDLSKSYKKFKFLDHLISPGISYDLKKSRGYIYLSNFYNGTAIINNNFDWVGQLGTPYANTDLEIFNNYLFLSGWIGFSIFDITIPELPKKMYSSDAIFYGCFDLLIYDDYLYAADIYDGLYIFNIKNKRNPLLINKIAGEGYYKLFLFDNLLFVCLWNGGFYIYDVSIPENPAYINYYGEGIGGIYCLQKYNDFLYIADVVNKKVHILRLKENKNVEKLTEISFNEQVFDLIIYNNKLYLNLRYNYLYVYDLEDPSNPNLLRQIFIPYNTDLWNIYYSSEKIYIAAGESGILIYNISNL